MKRVAPILTFLTIMLSLSLISSAGIIIELDKDEFYQDQLLQAEIIGTFTDNLKLENIGIYKDDKIHKTPAESELLKIENKYLYYTVLPSIIGNYSIQIQDIEYYIGQETSEETIIKHKPCNK